MRTVLFAVNFPPAMNPRAFRAGILFSLLSQHKEVICITSEVNEVAEKNDKIVRCGFNYDSKTNYRDKLKNNKFLRYLHSWIWPDEQIIQCIIHLMVYLVKYKQKGDGIITMSNPFSSHIIGLFLKLFFNHRWTIDVGDIYYRNKHNSKFSRLFEQWVLNKADRIIVNAESIRSYYTSTFSIPLQKIAVIPNPLHLDYSRIQKIDSELIRLSYIGNTYAGVREGKEEIKILMELVRNSSDVPLRIQLVGRQDQFLQQMAKADPELLEITHCANEEELIDAYCRTDILLDFANKNYPGLSSKLYEYLSSGLPVIQFYYSETDPSFLFLKLKMPQLLQYKIGENKPEELIRFIKLHAKSVKKTGIVLHSQDELQRLWLKVLTYGV